MAETIKRGMTVEVDVKGAAAANAAIAKTGSELEKAGTRGSASLSKIDGGVNRLSQGMAKALDPIDKAFAGTDRLNGIIGKAGAVGAIAAVAYEAVSAGMRALYASATEAAAAQDALYEATQRVAEQGRALAQGLSQRAIGFLTPEQVLQFQADRRDLENAQNAYLIHVQESAQEEAEIRAKWGDHFADGARKRHQDELVLMQSRLNDRAFAFEREQRKIKEIEDRLAEPEAPAKSRPAGMPDARSGDAWRSLKAEAASYMLGIEVQLASEVRAHGWRMEALAKQERAYAAMGKHAARFARAQREAFDAKAVAEADKITGALGGATEAFGSAAAAAVLAGESIMGVLNQQLVALAAQAVWEALKSTATGLYYLAVPGMQASAGLAFDSAAVWGAIAAGAGLGAAASGGMGGSGGGGGGAPSSPSQASSSGLSGQGGGSDSPVVVQVNFAGPSSGIGRYLADELNTEARRAGGARLDPRAVR